MRSSTGARSTSARTWRRMRVRAARPTSGAILVGTCGGPLLHALSWLRNPDIETHYSNACITIISIQQAAEAGFPI